MTRYIHKWYTPIVVKIFGVDEHRYYGPCYNPQHLPVVKQVYSDDHYYYWYLTWLLTEFYGKVKS